MVNATGQVVLPPYPNYTLRTINLSTLPDDREPLSLDVIDELVAPVGSTCPEGTRCIIRGYFGNSGTSTASPGRFRHFELLAPVPSLLAPLGVSVGPEVSSFNTNFPKKLGRQGTTATSTLAFCSIGERWLLPPTPPSPERVVSVVDSMTSSFDPATGDKSTNLLGPNSGSMPQGGVVFTTYVEGRHSRFYAVANFRDGTITIFDWTNASNVAARREIEVDHAPTGCAASDPYGDLTRGIAVMTPSVGPPAGKTMLLVGLNFDGVQGECENLDWDDTGAPDCSVDPTTFDYPGTFPDEGFTDFLVMVDVTGVSSANCSTVGIPTPTYISLQSSRFGTVTAVTPHLSGETAYVVTYDNPGFNSCDPAEKTWLISVDMATLTFYTSIQLNAQSGITDFNATQGHCPIVRNDNLQTARDRLYIPAFNSGSGPGRIMILDVSQGSTHEKIPVVLGVIEDPQLNELRVQDLSAVPISGAFLGSDLTRNVLFGLASHPINSNLTPKLFVLEDR